MENLSPIKILYGIQGEGRGHVSRSLHLIEKLNRENRQIFIFSGGDAMPLLKGKNFDVTEVPLFRLYCGSDGSVSIPRMAMKNAFKFLGLFFGIGKKYSTILKKVKFLQPDLIISDFEPYVLKIGPKQGIPTISIDHQQMFTECELPQFKSPIKKLKIFTYKIFILLLASYPDKKVISSFYEFKPKQSSGAVFVGPYISEKIAKQPVTNENRMTVYLKEPYYVYKLLNELKLIRNIEFEIFANWKLLERRPADMSNVKMCDIDQDRFIKSLASSMALITTAGNQVIGEAIFLGKPVFAFPKLNDIEQEINATGLADSGCGDAFDLVNLNVRHLIDFIKELPNYRTNINHFKKAHLNYDGTLKTLYQIESVLNKAPDEVVEQSRRKLITLGFQKLFFGKIKSLLSDSKLKLNSLQR